MEIKQILKTHFYFIRTPYFQQQNEPNLDQDKNEITWCLPIIEI